MRALRLLVFLLLVYSSAAQNRIVEYEYWLDDNFMAKSGESVSPSEEFYLQEDIDLSSAGQGFHMFHIRFADSQGRWSSPISKLIYKMIGNDGAENEITAYEYWTEGKFDMRQSGEVDESGEILLDDLMDMSSLDNGFHIFHIRFLDAGGNYSVPHSALIFKMGNSNEENNLITKYRYWFDGDFGSAVNVDLPEPMAESALNFMVPIPSDETESFGIQFLDAGGLWSSPHTRLFIPEADFEMYSTINTYTFMNKTTFGGAYEWDFGDGSALSTDVNPTHEYTTPGVYDVCLIATNKLGADTLCQIATVNGLREVVAKSAGNSGWASVLVYGGGLEDGSEVWLEKDGEKYLDAEDEFLARLDAISARFDLYDKETGTYDVAVELPGGEIWRLEDAFEIVPGELPEPYISFNGRDRILFGRWQTYTIDFGNTGNTDALGVPVYLLFTMPDGMDIEFRNLNIKISEHWKDNPDYQAVIDEPDYYERVGFFDGPERVRLYTFYIPVIPAGLSGQVKLRIVTNESFRAYVWMNEPMFEVGPDGVIVKRDSPLSTIEDKKTAACLRAVMAQAMKDGIADIVNYAIPGVGCANSVLNLAFAPAEYLAPEPTNPEYKRPKSWGETFWSWGNTIKDYSLTIAGCATDLLPIKQAVGTAIAAISVANNIYGGLKAGRECYDKYKNGQKNVSAVSSFDPNEIVGPPGFTDKNYLNTDAFSYTIFFENKESATAPAQEVVIVDTLDSERFDFSTFAFGMFAFGGHTYMPLPGLQEFTLDIDQPDNSMNIVRVNAVFDPETGLARWQFITLDKSNMALTEDPDGGFLPPNVNSPEGEGSVSYAVKLKEGLANDSEIRARAKIFFDLNEPIVTNEYLNTLDLDPPGSKIEGIYYTKQENVYRLEISGSDSQSGIAEYVIYISEDDGPFEPMYTTKETQFYFAAEDGPVYKLYSIAIDHAGNSEAPTGTYDVSTLNVSAPEAGELLSAGVDIQPNPVSGAANVEFIVPDAGEVTLRIWNSFGELQVVPLESIAMSAGPHSLSIASGGWPQGMYYLQMIWRGRTYTKMFAVMR
ncbi:MAG: PKD domain-containing protein [Candidatus Kapaibacterium sp.]